MIALMLPSLSNRETLSRSVFATHTSSSGVTATPREMAPALPLGRTDFGKPGTIFPSESIFIIAPSTEIAFQMKPRESTPNPYDPPKRMPFPSPVAGSYRSKGAADQTTPLPSISPP
jgi:hypothetical protein